MEITNEVVADFLEEVRGNMRTMVWSDEFGSANATQMLKWVDSLGIARCPGRGRLRRLLVPLDEALEIIRSETYQRVHKPRRHRPPEGDPVSMARKVFRVVEDPSGFFRAGAEFPALTVWGVGGRKPPEGDEFAEGTVLDLCRRRQGQMQRLERYVFRYGELQQVTG